MVRQWPCLTVVVRHLENEEKFWEWLSFLPVRGVWQIAERTWKVYLDLPVTLSKPDFVEFLVPGEEKDEQWAEKWRETFHMVQAGKNISVRPPWMKPLTGSVEIVIYPAYAFGTGDHPTTMLCLAMMERYLQPGMDVLDVGTGSGVLAILACKLGAGKVCGLDRDPLSIAEVQRNLFLNNIAEERVELILGTPDVIKGTYDMVAANIGYEFHRCALYTLTRCVREGGILLLSGISPAEGRNIHRLAQKAGLHLVDESESHEWAILVYNKSKIRYNCICSPVPAGKGGSAF